MNVTGIVKSHAVKSVFPMPQFMAFNLCAAPVPIFAVVITCVVLTGRPIKLFISIIAVADICALNPCSYLILKILVPYVLIILHAPVAVPNAIANEHNTITHKGG